MSTKPSVLSKEFEGLEAILLDSLPEGIWFADRHGLIQFWSKGAEAITGYAGHEVQGLAFGNVFSYCGPTGELVAVTPMQQTLNDGVERSARLFCLHKQGHRFAVDVQTAPVRVPAGDVIGAVEILRESKDATTLHKRARVLEQYGLWETKVESASPEYMLAQLELRLEQFRLDGIATGALLIDIDHLGHQDRNLGREAGDLLLATVSRTTLLCMRVTDVSGRWGDDSILAILETPSIDNLVTAAEQMRRLIGASGIRWWGEMVKITVTIGCTMFRADDTASSVMSRLDEGVAEGGKLGGNRALVV